MAIIRRARSHRTGGIYITVLGTALVASLLGLTALVGQRIQNRIITAAADIRQAQLNAGTAVELGLLAIKQNDNWRSLRDGQNFLFINRTTGSGSSCSLQMHDAPSDATDVADQPVKLIGIGRHGPASGKAPRTAAEQRVEVVIDPRRKPHDCLKPGNDATPTWQTVFDHYGGPPVAPSGVGTKIELTSLPDRAPPQGDSFAQNVSVTYSDSQWYRADQIAPGAPEFASANVDRRENYLGHVACIEVRRSDRKGGPANRLKSWLLKPNTRYRVDAQIYAGLLGNSFKVFLVTETDGSIQVVPGDTTDQIIAAVGLSWQDCEFYVTTPAWTTHPDEVYLAINTNTAGGSALDFCIDNIDVYETNARFIYQTVLGSGVNNLYAGAPTNSQGTYWIDCQNTKLVIERSRVFGTLLVENPGLGSCIDYGPVQMSPAVPGYPTLLVCNAGGNAFSIRSTPGTSSSPNALTEGQNLVNFNPPGAPHKALGTDSDQSDAYDSEIRGLVVVSGSLTYANSPTILGKVLVGGSVTGTPSFTYLPDSLLNPPPPLGGFYTYHYDRRPASTIKAVLP